LSKYVPINFSSSKLIRSDWFLYYRLCICPHDLYIKCGIGTEKPSGSV